MLLAETEAFLPALRCDRGHSEVLISYCTPLGGGIVLYACSKRVHLGFCREGIIFWHRST
jgi:hypothetical protein